MEEICRYYFHILRILELLWKSYLPLVCFKLDMILSFTNITNFMFVHNRFGLYARFFTLIIGIYLQWKPGLRSLSMSFSSDIVIVVLLDSCVVLRLPSRGNLVANMQLLCYYSIGRNYKGSQSTDLYLISSMQVLNIQALLWLVKIFNVYHRHQYGTSSGVSTVLYFIFRYTDLLVGILIYGSI